MLFELVGDPKRLTEAAAAQRKSNARFQSGGGALSTIQQAAGEYLDLTFQLGAIDYTAKNMVHADATAEQFDRMQKERGETTDHAVRARDAGADDGADEQSQLQPRRVNSTRSG